LCRHISSAADAGLTRKEIDEARIILKADDEW
jgi:hypothetical protein